MRLSGFDAIEFAEKEGLTLNKSADHIDDGASGLTVAEAEAIADDHPELIWVDVSPDEYYGDMRNMEPGTEATRSRRLAGQRPDELLPGQNSGPAARDVGAAGTPGGGLAAGGLGGTNAPDGSLDAAESELQDLWRMALKTRPATSSCATNPSLAVPAVPLAVRQRAKESAQNNY